MRWASSWQPAAWQVSASAAAGPQLAPHLPPPPLPARPWRVSTGCRRVPSLETCPARKPSMPALIHNPPPPARAPTSGPLQAVWLAEGAMYAAARQLCVAARAGDLQALAAVAAAFPIVLTVR